jgi:hypothetical protein
VRAAYEAGALDTDMRPRLLRYRHGSQFSECLTIQLSLDDEKDAIKAALFPQVLGPFIGPCQELHDAVFGKPVVQRTDYSRYWHGYRAYLWPMLSRFDVQTMRYINALILLACLILFYRGVHTALGATPALVFFLVLMSLTDIWRIWTITQHFLSMALILVGSGLFAPLYRRWRDAVFAFVYAAVFGAVFGFVDALINPPMAPLLVAFFVLAMEPAPPAGSPFRAYLGSLALAALVAASWFSGYALTWIMKWAMAVWFAPDGAQMAREIYEQIALRSFGQEKDRFIYFIPLWPTLQMIGKAFISIGSIAVAAIAAAIGLHLREHRERFDRTYFFAITMPAVIPILWFELLSNHTQTHLHFTYRSESAVIAMVLAVAVMAVRPQPSARMLWDTLRRNAAALWPGRRRSPPGTDRQPA